MKSDRSAALLLMAAAFLGVLVANSPLGGDLQALKLYELNLGLFYIDLEHMVSELLLAVFFLLAGLELKYELRIGALSTLRAALVPVFAALAGVIVPALLFLSINPSPPASGGWPVPTATDIAFALGMLAIIGRGLPTAARVFLLALAIFDDLIAILLIAFLFTEDLQISWLFLAVGASVALRVAFRKLGNLAPVVTALAFIGVWLAVHESGVHATVAGVLIGFAIPSDKCHTFSGRLQPWSNGFILPLFAFTAVSIQLPGELESASAVMFGIAVALPLGKIIGIALVASLMNRLAPTESRLKLTTIDFAVVGALAGIGFTVSLLLAKLAYANNQALQSEAIFGVLFGSLISILLAILLVKARGLNPSRHKSEAL